MCFFSLVCMILTLIKMKCRKKERLNINIALIGLTPQLSICFKPEPEFLLNYIVVMFNDLRLHAIVRLCLLAES